MMRNREERRHGHSLSRDVCLAWMRVTPPRTEMRKSNCNVGVYPKLDFLYARVSHGAERKVRYSDSQIRGLRPVLTSL